MLRRTLYRLKIVFLDNRVSIPLFLIFLGGTLCAMSYLAQCLLVDIPVRTIHLIAPEDAEVRAETSVASNAFRITVEASEWQSLYKNRQEGSRSIVVVRHNGIQSWLPRFDGVLYHSFVERPIFAGAHVQSFWYVGAVEKVSANAYRVTASKDWAPFVLAVILAVVSGLISFCIYADREYAWSNSWNRSLHHV